MTIMYTASSSCASFRCNWDGRTFELVGIHVLVLRNLLVAEEVSGGAVLEVRKAVQGTLQLSFRDIDPFSLPRPLSPITTGRTIFKFERAFVILGTFCAQCFLGFVHVP